MSECACLYLSLLLSLDLHNLSLLFSCRSVALSWFGAPPLLNGDVLLMSFDKFLAHNCLQAIAAHRSRLLFLPASSPTPQSTNQLPKTVLLLLLCLCESVLWRACVLQFISLERPPPLPPFVLFKQASSFSLLSLSLSLSLSLFFCVCAHWLRTEVFFLCCLNAQVQAE